MVHIATTVLQALKSRVRLQNVSILGGECCTVVQIDGVSDLPDGSIFCHEEVLIIYQ